MWHLYESPTTFFSLLLPHIFAGREDHAATVAVHCENIRNFHSCAIPVKPTLFPHFLPNRVLVRDLPLAGQVRSLSHCPQSSGSAIVHFHDLPVQPTLLRTTLVQAPCWCYRHLKSQLWRRQHQQSLWKIAQHTEQWSDTQQASASQHNFPDFNTIASMSTADVNEVVGFMI